MGKNHRHKKQLKSEKAKVKLRVKNEKTKFLSKGQNVTDLSFKVKQIVLPQQLQEKDQNEVRSKRNLNCKELLTRLRHHNLSSKVEACEELSQILTAHSDELERNYAIILKGLCPLILDIQKKVRTSAIKALEAILKVSVIEKLEPFFNVIFSYLKCALTHLDMSIQEDSLKVVDSLLKYAPNLIANHATIIIGILISLMSKQGQAAKGERTLTVVLGKKLTSTKWRIKVLERIATILDTLIDTENQNNVSYKKTATVECGSKCFISLYSQVNVPTLPISYLDASVHDQANLVDVTVKNGLVTLLFEIWLEESSSEHQKEDMTLLNEDNAIILNLILTIIDNIWTLLNISECTESTVELLMKQFNASTSVKFWDTVLRQFPYGLLNIQNVSQRGPKKADESQISLTDVNCTKENLLICKLFSTFRTNPIRKFTDVTTILNCIEDILRKGKIPTNCLETLTLFLNEILVNKSEPWEKRGVCFKSLIEALMVFYNQQPISQTKIDIFTLFCKISILDQINIYVDYGLVFSSFSSVISSPFFGKDALEAIKLIVRQQHPILYTDSFEKNIDIILDIIFASKEKTMSSNNKTLMEMIVYVPKISKNHEVKINQFLSNNYSTTAKYLSVCIDVRRTITNK